MAELERQQEKLVSMYNAVFMQISTMKTAKDYLATRNLLNVFSSEEGVNTVDIYKLRKMLDQKVTDLLKQNDKQMEIKQTQIAEIRAIRIEESTEQLKELDLRSNNILYKYMSLLHMNNIQENADRRRIGQWAKEPTREEAVALQKLCALPQYSGLFTEKQRKVIVENAKNPGGTKARTSHQATVRSETGRTKQAIYGGFQLRRIKKQISNDLKNSIKE